MEKSLKKENVFLSLSILIYSSIFSDSMLFYRQGEDQFPKSIIYILSIKVCNNRKNYFVLIIWLIQI